MNNQCKQRTIKSNNSIDLDELKLNIILNEMFEFKSLDRKWEADTWKNLASCIYKISSKRLSFEIMNDNPRNLMFIWMVKLDDPMNMNYIDILNVMTGSIIEFRYIIVGRGNHDDRDTVKNRLLEYFSILLQYIWNNIMHSINDKCISDIILDYLYCYSENMKLPNR